MAADAPMWMFGVTRVRDTSHFRNGLCRSSGGCPPLAGFCQGWETKTHPPPPAPLSQQSIEQFLSHPLQSAKGGAPHSVCGVYLRAVTEKVGHPPGSAMTLQHIVSWRLLFLPVFVVAGLFLAGAPSPAVSSPHVSVVPGIPVMVGFWVTVCDAELCRRRTECPIYSQASLPGVFTSTPGRVAR